MTRVYRIGALVILCLSPAAFLQTEQAWLLLGLYWFWAAQIAGVGELVGRGVVTPRVGGIISSVGGVLLLPAILFGTVRAHEGVMYPALVCMPLIIAALAPQDRPSVLINAVGGLGWLLGLELHAHHPVLRVIGAASVSVACSIIAVAATLAYEKSRRAEGLAVELRLEALKQLALSEGRRSRAERLALVGQLSAGVAHEINNPLSFLSSNIDFLRKESRTRGPTNPETEEVFNDTEMGLGRIRQIVLDLKTFAHPGAIADASDCNPVAAVAEALRLASVRLGKRVQVLNHVPAECPQVGISQGRLVQVLLNLLVNSADALDGPGCLAPPQIRISIEQPSREMVRIVVEDSGPGIPKEVLPHLFAPFFTTKQPGKGSGLGLALCREYLEAAGGGIGVENRTSGGARLPLSCRRRRSPWFQFRRPRRTEPSPTS